MQSFPAHLPVSSAALLLTVSFAVGALAGENRAVAVDPDDVADLAFFEKKIRPVLVEHCYQCHAADAKKVRGGLLLDSREAIRMGGESGPAAVPSKPDESLLLDAVRYESFEMPPAGQLPDDVIADFEHWIRRGAADPRDAVTSVISTPAIDIEAGKQFWSFQPLQHGPPSKVNDRSWPESNIDRYLLSRLEEEGIRPVTDADRSTLVRRVHYALVGLPPTPDDLEDFLGDKSPTPIALSKLVDRLLESEHFGERWGRHWLDVVRFAESSGGGRTLLFPNAWRYRDYVIEAFNDDMPYDQFLREQIAGDLLPSSDWETRRRQLVATSFLLLGPTNYELQDKDILEMDIVDEQVDTIGKAFLGMTIGCARCHDHKFDPIPTRDYYAMAGILKSTKSVIHENVSKWNTMNLPVAPDLEAELDKHESQIVELSKELDSTKDRLKSLDEDASKAIDATSPSKDAAQQETLRHSLMEQIKQLEAEIKKSKDAGPKRPVAMAAIDEKASSDIHVSIRGVVHNQGDLVPRGVLQVALTSKFPAIPTKTSGREQLADWIVDPTNPLTARMIVNRVWYWLLGEGLVRTVDNFGATGETPSHPELLDHLAREFMSDGWSLKRLIRRIMLSHVYRLSSSDRVENAEIDPNNRLFWRKSRQRLDAESIRDSLLQVAGTLQLQMGGPNIKPSTTIEYGYEFDSMRRSVYVPVFRNTLPPIFATFDFADPNIQVGKRTTSTIAPQALLMMNHPFVIRQSRHAAKRLLADIQLGADGNESRIDYCYQQVLGRKPTAMETELADQFVGIDGTQERWGLLYQTLFQSIHFLYVE